MVKVGDLDKESTSAGTSIRSGAVDVRDQSLISQIGALLGSMDSKLDSKLTKLTDCVKSSNTNTDKLYKLVQCMTGAVREAL